MKNIKKNKFERAGRRSNNVLDDSPLRSPKSPTPNLSTHPLIRSPNFDKHSSSHESSNIANVGCNDRKNIVKLTKPFSIRLTQNNFPHQYESFLINQHNLPVFSEHHFHHAITFSSITDNKIFTVNLSKPIAPNASNSLNDVIQPLISTPSKSTSITSSTPELKTKYESTIEKILATPNKMENINHTITQAAEKKHQTLLRQLQSDLSPKYIKISPIKGSRLSRYGREQKLKETVDFLPSDILYSNKKLTPIGKPVQECNNLENSILIFSPKSIVPHYNPHLKLTSPERQSYTPASHSPIEKLIIKNRMAHQSLLMSSDIISPPLNISKNKDSEQYKDNKHSKSLETRSSNNKRYSRRSIGNLRQNMTSLKKKFKNNDFILARPIQKNVAIKMLKFDDSQDGALTSNESKDLNCLTQINHKEISPKLNKSDAETTSINDGREMLPKSLKSLPLNSISSTSLPKIKKSLISKKKSWKLVKNYASKQTSVLKVDDQCNNKLNSENTIKITTPSKLSTNDNIDTKQPLNISPIQIKLSSDKVQTVTQISHYVEPLLPPPINNDSDDQIITICKNEQNSPIKLEPPTFNQGSSNDVDIVIPNANTFKSELQESDEPCPSIISSGDSAKGSSIVDIAESLSDHNVDWKIGHLAWAKLGNFPFWPCIICESPATRKHITYNANNFKIHVRFFADNGRRSWVAPTSLMPFNGIESFEEKKRELPPNLKSKDNRLKAFTVTPHQQMSWHQAIVEAEMLATFPQDYRIEQFEKQLKKIAVKVSKPKKSKRSSTSSLFAVQRTLSTESKELQFDYLFPNMGLGTTSTPCLFNEIVDQENAMPQLKTKFNLSRSPTPESPAYEELSFNSNSEEKPNQTSSISPLESSNLSISPFPTSSLDNEIAKVAVNQSLLLPRSAASSILPISPVSSDMECNEDFLDFYKNIKNNILGDCSENAEEILKQLAMRMWMLKLLKENPVKLDDAPSRKTINDNSASKKASSSSNSENYKYSSTRRSSGRHVQISSKYQDHSIKIPTSVGIEKESHKIKSEKFAARMAEREKQQKEQIEKYFMQEYPKNQLFKGLSREFVCRICFRPSNLIKCSTASCNEYVHLWCSKNPERALESTNDNPKKKVGRKKKVDADIKIKTEVCLGSDSSVVLSKGKLQINERQSEPMHVTGDDISIIKQQLISNESHVGDTIIYCPDCSINMSPVCFVCKTFGDDNNSLDKPLKCTEKSCGRYFHVACLKYWPQNKIVYPSEYESTLLCPCHVCHTCISDDPRGKHYLIENKKLTKCVKCPSTYHIDSCCVPAGSIILTQTQIICPRHRIEYKKPVNADWCFICTRGGQLICCETCPTAFHMECLKIPPPGDKYICEECETGRLPLYGEIVWAKLAGCKWWPSIIVPPFEIPNSIANIKHKPHDLCVRFFGTYNFSWISRGFVFLYQEDDSDFDVKTMEKSKDRMYKKSIEDAKELFEKLKIVNSKYVNPEREKLLQPLPYTKIKTNKPVAPVRLMEHDLESEQSCECSATDVEPCGINSGCLNRMLMVECNPSLCTAGDRCHNQCFDKKQYPSLLEKRIQNKGWGLVTLENIAAGSFIIEYVGELINQKEFERRLKRKQEVKDEHYYFLTINRDLMIDAGLKGNSSRFINHSCDPNCETQLWQVLGNTRVGLFAVQDISANTELTFNYNLECIGDEKKICHCGATKCAGYIGAKYVDQNVPLKLTKTANVSLDGVRGRKKKEIRLKEKKIRKYKKMNTVKANIISDQLVLNLESEIKQEPIWDYEDVSERKAPMKTVQKIDATAVKSLQDTMHLNQTIKTVNEVPSIINNEYQSTMKRLKRSNKRKMNDSINLDDDNQSLIRQIKKQKYI